MKAFDDFQGSSSIGAADGAVSYENIFCFMFLLASAQRPMVQSSMKTVF